jgi:hypothetical protein
VFASFLTLFLLIPFSFYQRVFIIGDQYDRNFLLQHFGGWLRVWLERVSARAEAAAFARAESHRDRRALRHAFARLLQAACNAQEKRQQTEQLWEKKGSASPHTNHDRVHERSRDTRQ